MRYSFHEIKSQPDYGEIVIKVNESYLEMLRGFEFPGLIDSLDKIQKGQLFGELELIDKNRTRIALVKVRRGIIEQMYLNRNIMDEHDYKPTKPFSVIWRQSIRNSNVRWDKKREASV